MMSLTPDQFRKVGLGVVPSPTPFLTPRPERRRMDSRALDLNSNKQDRDREVNVQVVLRCRPPSDDEQKVKVSRAVLCNEHKREVTVLQSLPNKQVDRIFTFDKVFGPKSLQRSIYDQSISPIVNEVLEGFNCTVFAYGQTGTGKTYTMEGGMRTKGGELPADAGVIPRAVRQIFDTLEAQNADYNVKVTFLELYNEEITDLLAREDNSRNSEDRARKPISLMEDGKGSVIVRGLEEESVYSANEIYSLMERGSAKRRTADTLLNKRSSRSHSVFSVTVYMKETAMGDEELIKCGKLNLVDLAGSENISRSGVRESRAREAGEINKSLLTLGRVINALVEHSVHIPYRDSKLTRLLRDSLGGKTKTCIIATISPSAHCLEETLSTLDYAHRAKNIKNKPEANQKMSKAMLLKDLYAEIERMKQDVRAAREKNGVYIPHERFVQNEAETKAKNEKIEQLEIDLSHSEKQVDNFRELYVNEQEQKLDIESELKECKVNLEKSNQALLELQENHRVAISTLKEKEFIISKLLQSENSLIGHAKELRNDLQNVSEDITSLFEKMDQKSRMETENRDLVLDFGSHLNLSLKDLHETIQGSVSQQQQQLKSLEEHACSFLANKCDATQGLESRINKMTEICTSGVAVLKELAGTLQSKASTDLEQMTSTVSSQAMAVENFLNAAILEAKNVISDIQNSLSEQKDMLAFSAQQQQEGLQCSLVSSQVISKASMGFFNDLHHQASKLMNALEESQKQKSDQAETFEKMFKEESAREEKQAMEKIAEILANFTSRRTAMVSETSRYIQNSSKEENKRLQQEVSNMQQVAVLAKEEVGEYLGKVEKHFLEETFSAAENQTVLEHYLTECVKMVDHSSKQWGHVQSYINHLNKNNNTEIESTVKARIRANHAAYEDFVSTASSLDAEFDAGACDMLVALNDSLMRDHKTKKGIDSISTSCFEQLKSVQEKHGGSISKILNSVQKCLTEDYLVDDKTTPKKRAIAIPSLASIEAMRTPAFNALTENMITENGSKSAERKIQQHQGQVPVAAASPNRTPFGCLN